MNNDLNEPTTDFEIERGSGLDELLPRWVRELEDLIEEAELERKRLLDELYEMRCHGYSNYR